MRVRKPLCTRHSVKIMTNRINAGIVCKSLFSQNVERPEAGFGNRPTRSAVTRDRAAGCILNCMFGLARVLTELIRREAIYGPMPIAVAGEFTPARLYFAHQVRKPFGHPTDEEKCSLGIVPVKEIQHTVSIRHHSGRPPMPAFSVN